MIINITVADRRATLEGTPTIVCSNKQGYSIKFAFDEEWGTDTAKTARFVWVAGGKQQKTDVIFTGDTVTIPELVGTTEVKVGVFEGDLQTTTPARIYCERSIRCYGGEPAEETPGQYDHIMTLYEQALELLAEVPKPLEVTLTQGADNTYSVDKAYNDIVTAYNSGADVHCRYQSDYVLQLSRANPGIVVFSGVIGNDYYEVTVTASNTLSVTTTPLTSSGSGSNGITPHIGDNGNWFIGETDTGMPSRGEAGPVGPQGEKGDTGAQGLQGKKGEKGEQGEAGAAGPEGPQGEKGEKGDTGATGPQGEKGETGSQGPKGDKGDPGATGSQGPKGDKGDTGPAGHTPVKGVDYWTQADQEAIVQQVITALGTPVFGRVDVNNDIILSGELAKGTYTLKYEDADGEVVTIGTLNHTNVPEPTYNNLLKTAITKDGAPYVGDYGEIGYRTGYRVKSDDTEVVNGDTCCTGFIPIEDYQQVLYLKNILLNSSPNNTIILYDSTFTRMNSGITVSSIYQVADEQQIISEGIAFSDDGNLISFSPLAIRWWYDYEIIKNIAYIRINAQSITDESVISDEEIKDNGTVEPDNGDGSSYTNLLEYYGAEVDTRFSSTNGAPFRKTSLGAIVIAIPFKDLLGKTLYIKSPNINGTLADGNVTNFQTTGEPNTTNDRFVGYTFNVGDASLSNAACAVYEGNNTYSFPCNDDTIASVHRADCVMHATIVVNTTGTAITEEELAQVVVTIDEPIV